MTDADVRPPAAQRLEVLRQNFEDSLEQYGLCGGCQMCNPTGAWPNSQHEADCPWARIGFLLALVASLQQQHATLTKALDASTVVELTRLLDLAHTDREQLQQQNQKLQTENAALKERGR